VDAGGTFGAGIPRFCGGKEASLPRFESARTSRTKMAVIKAPHALPIGDPDKVEACAKSVCVDNRQGEQRAVGLLWGLQAGWTRSWYSLQEPRLPNSL
jgi:hypothetical protein